MELEFEICNQSLKRTDNNKPADLSNEYLTCKFNFLSDDWEGMGKFAIFKCGDKHYREALNNGECIVPFDALQVNQFALTVYGIDEDTRITTNLVYIKLGKSGFVTEYDESSYFNPDMTETLLDLVETKTDKTVFNETVNRLDNSITNLDTVKVDKSTFNETVENITDSIGELDTNKTVTITKQDVADTGYFSTYVINQGGTALSPKINIPKDYLLKSASIKQCSEKGVPLPDLNVGDYYFDWVLNTDDGTGDETHLYLNANVLTDVYEADNETIIITDNVISVKPNVFAFKSHTHSKSDITDFTHTHSKSDITNFSHTHTKNDITDFAHNHDERYYTENEVDELLHELNNNIKVNGTSGIIQLDETVELYAYCKADGMPVLNKKVHFFKIEEDE